VVYFAEDGDAVFTTGDCVRMGSNEHEDPIPLFYCFGFDEADVCEEIARTGRSAIPQRISAMVKQGLCACEARNPSGACCLDEVTKSVTRLTRGGRSSDQAGAGARHAASHETIEELKLKLNTSLTCHLVSYNNLEKSKRVVDSVSLTEK
jgi:hypothetical protein